MPPNFSKFHGFGNDYIVVDAKQFSDANGLGEFARRICNVITALAPTASQ